MHGDGFDQTIISRNIFQQMPNKNDVILISALCSNVSSGMLFRVIICYENVFDKNCSKMPTVSILNYFKYIIYFKEIFTFAFLNHDNYGIFNSES